MGDPEQVEFIVTRTRRERSHFGGWRHSPECDRVGGAGKRRTHPLLSIPRRVIWRPRPETEILRPA
jgi:hypothetical protein